jgi:hypothetical protein
MNMVQASKEPAISLGSDIEDLTDSSFGETIFLSVLNK